MCLNIFKIAKKPLKAVTVYKHFRSTGTSRSPVVSTYKRVGLRLKKIKGKTGKWLVSDRTTVNLTFREKQENAVHKGIHCFKTLRDTRGDSSDELGVEDGIILAFTGHPDDWVHSGTFAGMTSLVFKKLQFKRIVRLPRNVCEHEAVKIAIVKQLNKP